MRNLGKGDFEVGDFVMATWDDTPVRVMAKDGDSYLVMRSYNHDVPKWLDFEDCLTSEEIVEKFPQYAFLFEGKLTL